MVRVSTARPSRPPASAARARHAPPPLHRDRERDGQHERDEQRLRHQRAVDPHQRRRHRRDARRPQRAPAVEDLGHQQVQQPDGQDARAPRRRAARRSSGRRSPHRRPRAGTGRPAGAARSDRRDRRTPSVRRSRPRPARRHGGRSRPGRRTARSRVSPRARRAAARAPPPARPGAPASRRGCCQPGHYSAAAMLIGAHVSPAGGLAKAVERGVERECDAIQIFNQSPRMWRPTAYGDEDFAAFREAFEASPLQAVLIHAVYLINCASEDAELCEKSLTSLVHSLRVGEGIGADGVVLHAGLGAQDRPGRGHRARRQADRARRSTRRSRARCTSRTRPAPAAPSGARSPSWPGCSRRPGAHERLGVCLDSCHLLASGYDVGTPGRHGGVARGPRPRDRPRPPALAARQRLA